MKKAVAIVWFLLAGVLYGGPLLFLPNQVAQGEVLTVLFTGETPGDMVLRDPEGTLRTFSPLYPLMTDKSAYYGILGIDSWWPQGEYTLDIEDPEGQVLFSKTIVVEAKEFLSESIPLNSTMTSLRTEEKEARAKEAQELWSLLGVVNTESLYHRKPFLSPMKSFKRYSSFYGDRRTYEYSNGENAKSIHNGLDYAAPVGTPVLAAGKGRVVMAKGRIITGNTVILEHMPGVYSLYYHLDKILVKTGDILSAGSLLGLVGSTGLVTGPHLHFEFRVNRIPVDPLFLFDRQLLDKTGLMTMIGNH